MRHLTITAAAALAVGACGSADTTGDTGAQAVEGATANAQNRVDTIQPVDNSAAPVPSDGGAEAGEGDDKMEWRFSRTAAGPKLVFGEPQTDNVRLSLRCEGDQVAMHFMRSAEVVSRGPDQLTIAWGGMQWRTGLSAEESELGGMRVTATLPASSAPISAFKSGQALEVRWGDETIRVPTTDKAQQFLAACR